MSYRIFRSYAPHRNQESKTIDTGLTLKEAKEHCNRDDTKKPGEWFDGYIKE